MSPAAPPAESGPASDEDPSERVALARGSAFNFVGLTASNGLQFALLIILSYGLGRHDAGVFFEGYAALRLLSVVAALGLDVTVIRYVAHYHARGESGLATSAVRLGLVLSGAVSVLAGGATFLVAPLAASAFGSAELEFVLRVMALSLPVVVLEMVLIGATRGTGRMGAFVVVDQVLDGAVRLGAVAVVLALGHGLKAAALAYALAGVVTLAAAAVPARGIVLGAREGAKVQPAALLRFTGYQWGAVVAGVGLLWLDTLLLGLWRPPADVAVYTVATRTVLLGMVFILPIGIAFQPMIGRLYSVGDRPRLESMYAFATKWSTIVGCPPLVFLALFATPLLTLLYGDAYASGAWALALLALAQTANASTGPSGHIVTMIGRPDLVLVNSLAALLLNLVLNVILIPPYGMVGAAAAWAVSIVAWNVFRLWQVWRVLRMHPFSDWPLRVAASLVVFVGAAAALRLLLDLPSPLAELLVSAVACVLVYGIALVTLRVVDARDRRMPGPFARLARGSQP